MLLEMESSNDQYLNQSPTIWFREKRRSRSPRLPQYVSRRLARLLAPRSSSPSSH
jgi:hypothetical protein